MAAEPRVREVMANLGPGGRAVVKMMLPQETEALRPTLLLLQSVQRRKGTNPVSGEVDYSENMGFVVTEVCVECAVNASAIHEDPREADGLFITVRDGDPEKGAGVLAQNLFPPPTPQDQLPSVVSSFTLGGRDLYIQVTATEDLYRRGDSMLPLALAGGILITVSLVLLYILLLHRRAQDQTMLADRMRVAREALEMEVREREKMEGHLHRAQRAESVGRLSGGIAHDFNNLLTAIVGNTSLLLSDRDLKEDDRRLVEEIDSAASMATNVTGQLLAFSSRQVLQPKLVHVDQVVGDMERMLLLFLGKEIELDLQLSAEAECVHVDVGQLQQAIVNLVVNAGDAIPEGRGRVTVTTEKVWVSDWVEGEEQPPLRGGEQMNEFVSRVNVPEGPYVRLTVADNGVGMSATVLEQAFEPFFTTKERGKGTGLGLAAIHGIMTQSSGMIRAYSAGSRGTVIAIYLPEAESTGETLQEPANAPESPTPEPAAEDHQTTQFGRSIRVMVVDDEQSVRRIAARTLKGEGYEIMVASDGEEALQLSSQMDGNLDLLITDVLMPGINGPGLAARLQREYPDMAVLYISGYAADSFSKEIIQTELFDLLEKPFRPEELTERVEAALARRGALSDEAT